MKLKEFAGKKPVVAEDATGGGTSSGSMASVIPGDGGFGKSIFMSRTEPKTIKKAKRK